MTAIVVPVGTGGGGGGGVANADNRRGTASGLAPLATATLVSFVAGSAKLRGFIVHGDIDAEAWVEVDGTPLAGLRARHSRVMPAYVVLPNPEVYSSPAATVTLRVQNTGSSAGDFAGTLLGE